MSAMIACPHCGLPNIAEKTICKQCKGNLRELPAPTVAEPISQDRRRELLETEIARQASQGWRVTNRTDISAQLERPRAASGAVAVLLLLIMILPGLIYLFWPRKPEGMYVTIDEYGRVKRTIS